MSGLNNENSSNSVHMSALPCRSSLIPTIPCSAEALAQQLMSAFWKQWLPQQSRWCRSGPRVLRLDEVRIAVVTVTPSQLPPNAITYGAVDGTCALFSNRTFYTLCWQLHSVKVIRWRPLLYLTAQNYCYTTVRFIFSLSQLLSSRNSMMMENSPALTEEIRQKSRMRGTHTWTPPRFQIIYNIHPPKKWVRLCLLMLFQYQGAGCHSTSCGVSLIFTAFCSVFVTLTVYFCDPIGDLNWRPHPLSHTPGTLHLCFSASQWVLLCFSSLPVCCCFSVSTCILQCFGAFPCSPAVFQCISMFPAVSVHLHLSLSVSVHLPVLCSVSVHLPVFYSVSVHLPISCSVSVHLPVSCSVSLHLHVSYSVSVHLFMSYCFSISPCILQCFTASSCSPAMSQWALSCPAFPLHLTGFCCFAVLLSRRSTVVASQQYLCAGCGTEVEVSEFHFCPVSVSMFVCGDVPFYIKYIYKKITWARLWQ